MSEIDDYLSALAEPQRAMATTLRQLVRAAGPSLTESLKWHNITFSREKNVIGIVLHRQHANLEFFRGAELLDRFERLEGTGKKLRHLKFSYEAPVDARLVKAVVRAAVKLELDIPVRNRT